MYTASSTALKTASAVADDYQLREISSWPIAALRVYCLVLEIPADASRPDLLQRLAADKRVGLAQPMQTFVTLTRTYNDPYLDLQRGFHEMDVATAHQWSRGRHVRVAVIDTGMDVSHADLRGRVALPRNFVDSDREQFERDRHGTEVAGVIAAVADNREGIVGVAPDVELLAFKACWQLQPGQDDARCNSFTLAQALVAAIDEKAQIVNLSVSGPADPLLSALVVQGERQGLIFVGAVETMASSTSLFPADTPGVLGIEVAELPASHRSTLLAPGREILTLLPAGHYEFASGPSIAAAHATGVIALLLAANKKLDAGKLRTLLARTSTRAGNRQGNVEYINACTALTSAIGHGKCTSGESSLVVKSSAQVH